MNDHDDIDILERRNVFSGYFAVDAIRLRHRRYDGTMGRPITRELFRRGHAVGVLLYDPQCREVGLVEQFRIGAHSAGFPAWVTEIVAGIIEPGEAPDDVARRECLEEAGVAVDTLLPVAHYVVSPGCMDETVRIFCARVDARRLGGHHGLAEEGEDIRVFTLALDEALRRCRDGRIANAMTIVALQWLALERDHVDRAWLAAP
jgi:ADP-ribose pyrophosphatase